MLILIVKTRTKIKTISIKIKGISMINNIQLIYIFNLPSSNKISLHDKTNHNHYLYINRNSNNNKYLNGYSIDTMMNLT